MWFKQAQVFLFSQDIPHNAEQLANELTPWQFTTCPPAFISSQGWVSPLEELDAPLVHALNHKLMICLQCEEKLLPATVIRQTVKQRVQELEQHRGQKISAKEKYQIKDEVISTLLPRAFTKLSRIYAYWDIKYHYLVLNTLSKPKTETFINWLKKSFPGLNLPAAIPPLSSELTHWLIEQDYPQSFSIEKSCVLIDPRQQQRIIRCQQQDLSAEPIQLILKDGCQVNQLALTWNDHVQFTLTHEGALRSIKYPDELLAQAKDMEAETERQQFEADFLIMGETLSALIATLAKLTSAQPTVASAKQPEKLEMAVS